jgi:hypothetical protein
MEVTVPGMVTLVKPLGQENPPPPMEVTVPLTPGIDDGIVMSPAGLVYPVIVMLVPLTV